jgi:hypothetical protein
VRILEGYHVTRPDHEGGRDQQPIAGSEGWQHAVADHRHPPEGPAQGPADGRRSVAAGRMGRVKSFTNHDQGASVMTIVARLLSFADRLSPPQTIHAHCDLPCGVYDPAQARIEAESVKGCMEKFNGSEDNVFKTRAVMIKEERAELVKHHLGPVDRLLQAAPSRGSSRAPRAVLECHQGSRRGQEDQ